MQNSITTARGFLQAEAALASLADDPQELHRQNARFLQSPRASTGHESGHSTVLQSPDATSDLCDSWRLAKELTASRPSSQLEAQIHDEEQRIIEAFATQTSAYPLGTNYYEQAYRNVKSDWEEQGIWDHHWDAMARGPWMHEEREHQAPQPVPALFSSQEPPPPYVQSCNKDASRPFNQFIWQLAKEGHRLQEQLAKRSETASSAIYTCAYNNVKAVWVRRGIWNSAWGIMPGRSWKHEHPRQEPPRDSTAPMQVDQCESSGEPVTRLIKSPSRQHNTVSNRRSRTTQRRTRQQQKHTSSTTTRTLVDAAAATTSVPPRQLARPSASYAHTDTGQHSSAQQRRASARGVQGRSSSKVQKASQPRETPRRSARLQHIARQLQ